MLADRIDGCFVADIGTGAMTDLDTEPVGVDLLAEGCGTAAVGDASAVIAAGIAALLVDTAAEEAGTVAAAAGNSAWFEMVAVGIADAD